MVDGREYSSVASQNTMHGKLITTIWLNDEKLHAQNAQLSWLVGQINGLSIICMPRPVNRISFTTLVQ